jgi:hypothetical protein
MKPTKEWKQNNLQKEHPRKKEKSRPLLLQKERRRKILSTKTMLKDSENPEFNLCT